jgi:hypothetical protein
LPAPGGGLHDPYPFASPQGQPGSGIQKIRHVFAAFNSVPWFGCRRFLHRVWQHRPP